MFITNKAAFGYKFLLSLFLVGMFASNGNASTVVPVDWLNNTSLNITENCPPKTFLNIQVVTLLPIQTSEVTEYA